LFGGFFLVYNKCSWVSYRAIREKDGFHEALQFCIIYSTK